MAEAKWRKFRQYSGPLVRPKGPAIEKPTVDDDHWWRAFWLTVMVESGGRPGLVNMYDGCGATCGLHQAIAVYPKNMGGKAQGPLWELIWRLDAITPVEYYIGELMDRANWSLTGHGLVSKDTGDRVAPRYIRDVLTPMGGKVPKEGDRWERSKEWAEALSRLFKLEQGLGTQIHFGIEHMQRAAKRVKVGNPAKTIEAYCYNGRALASGKRPHLYVDLAMSLFWCNFVNAPRPSKVALTGALNTLPMGGVSDHPQLFARELIQRLGNNQYGRWDDDIPGGRYQRSRDNASEVWPPELFWDSGVMPKDLPDA